MVVPNLIVAALLALAPAVYAHPGEYHSPEEISHDLKKRAEHAAHIQRGLAACLDHPDYQALAGRAQKRRAVQAERLRQERGIPLDKPYKTRHGFEAQLRRKRDLAALEEFEEVNHNMTSFGYTEDTSSSTLFALYKNTSCILTPEVVDGPYYVSGEYIRKDVRESQEGVDVYLEYQYIDVSTCTAATGLYLETWQANATGVYSGVVATGNGNGDSDLSNVNNTFLRGIQPVDDDGVAAFETIFAGHYSGRATHIHLMARQNGTVLANGTYADSTVSHIGQLFFQTDLKDAVEATYPYSTNTQSVTTNDDDSWAPYQADNDYDPFPDYAYLGDDISDGLLMWISIGIDMSADYDSDVDPAGRLTSTGGECNTASADGCVSGETEYTDDSSDDSSDSSTEGSGAGQTGGSGSQPTGGQGSMTGGGMSSGSGMTGMGGPGGDTSASSTTTSTTSTATTTSTKAAATTTSSSSTTSSSTTSRSTTSVSTSSAAVQISSTTTSKASSTTTAKTSSTTTSKTSSSTSSRATSSTTSKKHTKKHHKTTTTTTTTTSTTTSKKHKTHHKSHHGKSSTIA